MKLKVVYVSLTALVIVMLISLLIARQGVKIEPSVERVSLQQEAREGLNIPQGQMQQFAPAVNPGITIINTNRKEDPALLTQKRKPERHLLGEASGPSGQPQAIVSQGSEVQPIEQASGITKIGHRPTKEEVKEMNARGIVMY